MEGNSGPFFFQYDLISDVSFIARTGSKLDETSPAKNS
jgi:hypothetical protein